MSSASELPDRASPRRASTRAIRSRSRSAAISSARGCSPGDRIGTEQELAAEFGVSRPTLREGLRLLASSHLIRVGRGRAGGIFVARTPGEGMSRNVSESISMMLATETVSLCELLDARMFLEVPLAGLAAAQRRRGDGRRAAGGDRRGGRPRARHAAVQRRRQALPPDPRARGRQRAAAGLHRLDPRGAPAAADREHRHRVDGEEILRQHRDIQRAVRRRQPAGAETRDARPHRVSQAEPLGLRSNAASNATARRREVGPAHERQRVRRAPVAVHARVLPLDRERALVADPVERAEQRPRSRRRRGRGRRSPSRAPPRRS